MYVQAVDRMADPLSVLYGNVLEKEKLIYAFPARIIPVPELLNLLRDIPP